MAFEPKTLLSLGTVKQLILSLDTSTLTQTVD
jgi:hypothetical protein